MIETTSMSKTYKMPVLLAFYNYGNVKTEINEDDIYKSFYEFYSKGSNKVDMLRTRVPNPLKTGERIDILSLQG